MHFMYKLDHLTTKKLAICGAPVLPFCGACRRGEVEERMRREEKRRMGSGGEEMWRRGEEKKGKWRKGEVEERKSGGEEKRISNL